jgi:hypothetical protein
MRPSGRHHETAKTSHCDQDCGPWSCAFLKSSANFLICFHDTIQHSLTVGIMGIDVPKKRSVVLDTLHRIHQKSKGNSVDLASAKAAYGHYLSYEMGQNRVSAMVRS